MSLSAMEGYWVSALRYGSGAERVHEELDSKPTNATMLLTLRTGLA
jgi:hypothetical protein